MQYRCPEWLFQARTSPTFTHAHPGIGQCPLDRAQVMPERAGPAHRDGPVGTDLAQHPHTPDIPARVEGRVERPAAVELGVGQRVGLSGGTEGEDDAGAAGHR